MKLTRTQPGLIPSQPRDDLPLELVRPVQVDAEQPVAVRAGARAAAAGLDAEQVVEQRDDEVVVQVAPAAARRTTNETIDSRSASRLPRISMAGLARQALDRPAQEVAPRARGSRRSPTACLSWKTSPARIDSTIAGVPPSSRCTGSSR